MSIYKGTTLIAGALPNAANQDLSNLTSTASANFDGQWVSSTYDIITSSTILGESTNTYSLSSYLPNDNYIYEVYFSIDGTTGTSSGNQTNIAVYSSIIGDTSFTARARTRANSSVTWAGAGIIPIGTDREIKVKNYHDTADILHFRIFAYRRIGTNA